MKNILRNNLWMIIVAWCLETEGYSLMAITVTALASFYLYMNLKEIKVLKVMATSLAFLIYTYMLASVTVIDKYGHFELFLGLISLNVGLTVCQLQKERLNYLYKVFIFTISTYLIFFLATLLIPKNLISEVNRLNTLTLIMIIFLPYTLPMLVKILQKEYQKKLLLDKIERIAKAKEFNIKVDN